MRLSTSDCELPSTWPTSGATGPVDCAIALSTAVWALKTVPSTIATVALTSEFAWAKGVPPVKMPELLGTIGVALVEMPGFIWKITVALPTKLPISEKSVALSKAFRVLVSTLSVLDAVSKLLPRPLDVLLLVIAFSVFVRLETALTRGLSVLVVGITVLVTGLAGPISKGLARPRGDSRRDWRSRSSCSSADSRYWFG